MRCSSGDGITVKQHFGFMAAGTVDSLEFSDGTIWGADKLSAAAFGTSTMDSLLSNISTSTTISTGVTGIGGINISVPILTPVVAPIAPIAVAPIVPISAFTPPTIFQPIDLKYQLSPVL